MKALTKDQIFSAEDMKTEFVPCPEWAGGDKEAGLFVKTPTAKEQGRYEMRVYGANGPDKNKSLEEAKILTMLEYALDDKGKRVFNPDDQDQVRKLSEKSAAPVSRFFTKWMELAGMSSKDVEDMTKNFETGQAEGSPLN